MRSPNGCLERGGPDLFRGAGPISADGRYATSDPPKLGW